MAKIEENPIKDKIKKADVPADLISVIYYCKNCKGKHTYGPDYFVEIGPPATCPNCSEPFDQDEQIHRLKRDTEEDEERFVKTKRDELYRQRGQEVPVEAKPEDPEVLKQAKIEALNREILRLKGQEPDSGIRLGP